MCISHKTSSTVKNLFSGEGASLPGTAARVGPSPAGPVLHQTNLPPIDVCTVQLVQSPLHVRVGAELNHSLVGAFLMGIRVCHLSCLTHKILTDAKNVERKTKYADNDILTL